MALNRTPFCKRESVLTVSNAAPALSASYACGDKLRTPSKSVTTTPFSMFEQFIRSRHNCVAKEYLPPHLADNVASYLLGLSPTQVDFTVIEDDIGNLLRPSAP